MSLVLGVSGFVSSQVQAVNYTAADNRININTKWDSKATATGEQSVAVGGLATATGKQSVAVGDMATAGADYTIAVGHNAQAKSEGEVVVGQAAGSLATHQNYSLILGTHAGQKANGTSNENKSNGYNLYMGYWAGYSSSGGRNTFIGAQNAGSEAVGDLNIGIGQASLLRAKGNENTAVGAYSGQDVTGNDNSAVGTSAGKVVTGSYNSSLGILAGSNVEGNENTALGSVSGTHVVGDYNMSLGTESAYNVHGNSNLLIGRRAGTATKIVEGDGETYEDYDAEATPVTGDRNIIVGESAGVSLVGSDNIVMGTNAGIGMNANQSIAIGSETVANHDDVVALGNHIQTTAAHSVFLGDGAAYVSESNRTKGIATDHTNMMIDGSSYAIAGGSEVVGVMSVGSDTTTRRIQNVAPGLVGPDSTDAVNGSQLYAVTKSMGENIHNLRQESRRGDAMNAALAALKPVAYNPAEPTQIMAGIGNYRGESAVALGAAHYVNGRTMINGGVAFSGDSRIMANLGLTWRIGQGEVPEDIGADNDKIVLALNTRVDSLEKVVDKQNSIIQQQTAKMDAQQQRIEQQQVQIDKLLALLQTK
ncbi:YadA-like family protein [Veillonella magna]|uniref:YadA-like family protein n=1 Tax=Veillonella magna TaxID=464322 RepID=A0ABS2GK37_9FIRM|nr:YadA-like family protein [Veillonella magna]MBM6825333.1 YadA-like family protein [Veillonella magna]MBM6913618.1 YadA-like family protein [Veillonella magna]